MNVTQDAAKSYSKNQQAQVRKVFLSITINKLCVFGNPIAQSKSPTIHLLFAEQFNLPIEYEKRFAETDAFVASAEAFFADPTTVGANITMPFKHDALEWVDELSEQAQRAGAVNTIIRTNNGFVGDNTDGYGLVTDLLEHDVTLKHANILIIGAGGAAKGALPALVEAGINSVTIYNRSTGKAESLVAHTNSYKKRVARLYDIEENNFDVVINATSLSLSGDLPNITDKIFEGAPAVYDMVYLSEPTAFLKHAQTCGCKTTIDGLGMLINQAARSFYLWFGEEPNTQLVSDRLRG